MTDTNRNQSASKSGGSTVEVEAARKSNQKTRAKKAAAPRLKELKQRVEALEKERDQLRDRLLRTAAEFENYKKRRESEIGQLIAYANAELLTELLPVIDDYERSLKAAKDTKDFDSFYQGIELIYKKLMGVLAKQGVKPIHAVGQPFDPELHDALLQVESNDHEAGIVVEEHLKGYKMHDRVLRHAQVIVSK